METSNIRDYNEWANESSKNADSATKNIFETLVDDEERHFDQYDNEMENLAKFGNNYHVLQSIEHSKSIGANRPTE